MRRMFAVGVALALAACGGAAVENGLDVADETASVAEDAPPTAIDLNGIWLQVEDPGSLGVLVRFNPDGTFALDDRGELFAEPAAVGTFEVNEDAVVFTADGSSDVCAGGDSWAWQAVLPEAGLLRIEHTEEGTGDCQVPSGTAWTLARVYLPSAAARTIADTGPAEGPPPDASELPGIWLQVPLGVMVWFTRDGEFAIDNGGDFSNASVSGTYTRDGDTITFPDVVGHACPGDSFAWRVGLPEDGLLRVEHIEEASGNCGIPNGTLWTLLRISPGSVASARINADEMSG